MGGTSRIGQKGTNFTYESDHHVLDDGTGVMLSFRCPRKSVTWSLRILGANVDMYCTVPVAASSRWLLG